MRHPSQSRRTRGPVPSTPIVPAGDPAAAAAARWADDGGQTRSSPDEQRREDGREPVADRAAKTTTRPPVR